ncbi:MAG: hypothetical protein JRI47_08655 [Deltaproteobacteria bacterium]|nr:hypothetical protein [Deltaproteobacteria bacterium]
MTGGSLLLFLLIAGLCLTGCGGNKAASSPSGFKGPFNIETLYVAPFHVATERYEVGTTMQCSMCGAVFVTGPVGSGDDVFMTEQLLASLRSETPYVVIPPEAGEGERSKILSESLTVSRHALLLQMGQNLGAEAVVSGTLFRFRQREGTGFSVETPASVAFSVYLVRVSDGRLLWDGHFDQTQKPLSEDFTRFFSFVKSGWGWLTAEQLAQQGMEQVMDSFPMP